MKPTKEKSTKINKNIQSKKIPKDSLNHGLLLQQFDKYASRIISTDKKKDENANVPSGFKPKMCPNILKSGAITKPYTMDKPALTARRMREENISIISKSTSDLNATMQQGNNISTKYVLNNPIATNKPMLSGNNILRRVNSSTLYKDNSTMKLLNYPVTSTVTSGAYNDPTTNQNTLDFNVMTSPLGSIQQDNRIVYGPSNLPGQSNVLVQGTLNSPLLRRYNGFQNNLVQNKENNPIAINQELNDLLQSTGFVANSSELGAENPIVIEIPMDSIGNAINYESNNHTGNSDALCQTQSNGSRLTTTLHENNKEINGIPAPVLSDLGNENFNQDRRSLNNDSDDQSNDTDNQINDDNESIRSSIHNDGMENDDLMDNNNEVHDDRQNGIHHNHRDADDEINHHTDNCCVACCMHFIQIQNKLNSIEAKIDSMLNNRNLPRTRENFNLLPDFPFDVLVDLESFDTNLQLNEQMQDQFERKISSLGGDGIQKISKNIMTLIITDELAKNLTWVANVENKTAISQKFFITLIILL